MMIVEARNAGPTLPHPEERRLRLVSKDERVASWFETAQVRLLTMRGAPHRLDSDRYGRNKHPRSRHRRSHGNHRRAPPPPRSPRTGIAARGFGFFGCL